MFQPRCSEFSEESLSRTANSTKGETHLVKSQGTCSTTKLLSSRFCLPQTRLLDIPERSRNLEVAETRSEKKTKPASNRFLDGVQTRKFSSLSFCPFGASLFPFKCVGSDSNTWPQGLRPLACWPQHLIAHTTWRLERSKIMLSENWSKILITESYHVWVLKV